MNFKKSDESLERETPVFMACHGNSVNNTNTIRQFFFLVNPDAYVFTVKISFN